MYESGCAFSPRTNFMWYAVLFIITSYDYFKQTIVLRNKPTTIAMSS